MKYALLYKPKQQYLNITKEGFYINLNPRTYETRIRAEKALNVELPEAIIGEKRVIERGNYAVETHKPVWYEERHNMKLKKSQQNTLDWYEKAVEKNKKSMKFVEEFDVNDVEIVELT